MDLAHAQLVLLLLKHQIVYSVELVPLTVLLALEHQSIVIPVFLDFLLMATAVFAL